MRHADGTPKDAWRITPEAKRLSNAVVYSPERPDNTGFLHTTRSWRNDENLKQVAKTLYKFLLKDDGPAKMLCVNLATLLRGDCEELGRDYDTLTADDIEAVWTGRYLEPRSDLEFCDDPDACPSAIAAGPMPDLGSAGMSVKEGGTWSDVEVEHFGDVGNWVRERLNEMDKEGGCQLNWTSTWGGGGKDGQVPTGTAAELSGAIRPTWFLSGPRLAAQPRV